MFVFVEEDSGKEIMDKIKLSAYQTLYTCLETVAVLSAPIAPFFMDRLFQDLNKTTKKNTAESVHLAFLLHMLINQ